MSRIKDESDIDTCVDVIASGYEWICPVCEKYNKEIEFTEKVQCQQCRRKFDTNPPEHAFGS